MDFFAERASVPCIAMVDDDTNEWYLVQQTDWEERNLTKEEKDSLLTPTGPYNALRTLTSLVLRMKDCTDVSMRVNAVAPQVWHCDLKFLTTSVQQLKETGKNAAQFLIRYARQDLRPSSRLQQCVVMSLRGCRNVTYLPVAHRKMSNKEYVLVPL